MCAPLPAGLADLAYDANGNVIHKTTPGGSTSFTYDPLDRLDTEAGPTGTRNHDFDPNGNRTTDGAGTTASFTPSTDRIQTINGIGVTLDAAGNLTSDGSYKYLWNGLGQLAELRKPDNTLIASYYYDHQNLRTRKLTTAAAPQGISKTFYHYDEAGHLIAETAPGNQPLMTYIWNGDSLTGLIVHPPQRTVYTVQTDHLGSPFQVRTLNGTVVWRWESEAFGKTLPNEDVDGDGSKLTLNLRFPGQYYDRESGLHYNWNRYYSPRLGRYISSDPIGLYGGLNTYLYANANPLGYTDPLGLTAITFDPSTGTLTVDPQTKGRVPYTMSASSGRPNCGCDETNKNKGPIPKGSYMLNNKQLTNPVALGDIVRNLRGDWGDWRAPLTPSPGTNTHGRSGFFLHGGSYAGSAGCIDVGGGIFGNDLTAQLLKDIMGDPDGTVPVIVK